MRKYLHIILCSVALLLLAAYVSGKEESPLLRFFVQGPQNTAAAEISIHDAHDGNYYVFLPSYTSMEDVTVSLATRKKLSIGGASLFNKMDCGSFDPEVPYAFCVNGQKIATLWFYQSKNVATMYIDTVSGGMEYIHEDKNFEETASVMLYTAQGELNFSDKKIRMEGRGNGTWANDKRPYSMTLSADGDLLDMGAAANWVLLANAYDETNLNNKLAFDLASRAGSQWSPDSRWVDLYLNGKYNGLYLLTEKIEVHSNRLNIDAASGEFLCKIDLNERWDKLRNPYLTKSGRTVEITDPRILSQREYETAGQLVDKMEQAILSGDDLHDSALIDLDSWVRRYLIDEITGNIDSDIASSYFYYSAGMFHAGPVWDYDMAFGNNLRNQEPHSFIAKNAQKSTVLLSPYYSALYENDSFSSRVKEIYLAEFRPILQQMADQEIDALAAHIQKASQLNSLRWHRMFDKLQSATSDLVHTTAELKAYFSDRIAFLDSAWIENTDFCTVQFAKFPGVPYWSISVKTGDRLETAYYDIQSAVWYDVATGEAFDFSQPILSDLQLTMYPSDD